MWLLSALVAASLSAVLVALAAEAPTDGFLVYGPLGLLVVAFMLGQIVPKSVYDRAVADRDKAEQQRDAITQDVLQRVTPALERAIEVMNMRANRESEVFDVLLDVRRHLGQR